jgi:hypothetical protein
MESMIGSEGSFVVPSARAELEGKPGLTVHEVAQSLGSRFQEVRDAVEREWDNISELQTVSITTLHAGNGQEVQSYVLSVPAAQFIVARFGNKIGAAYCKYLIQQTQTLEQMEKACEESPELALKFAEAVKNRALAALEAKRAREIAAHALKALTTSQVKNGLVTKENKQLKTQVLALNEQVGNSRTYKTVKAMLKQLSGDASPSLVGKRCRGISDLLGLDIRKIEDTQYGSVNAYHTQVWCEYMRQYECADVD